MQTIRWGMIGAGDVTEVKSGPGFQKASGSALVAVMRRNGALAADYAQRHGVPRWYDDADALIADPEVDAVYIATPPASHCEYVLRCAAAGKPVYVEKPMAMNHAECLRMIDACQQAGVPLFVALYRRAMPRFLKVKELIDSGAIGSPRLSRITVHRPPSATDIDPAKQPWRLDPATSGGGHFVDLAPHQLDLLDYILGPITQASGYAGNLLGAYAAEDTVSGSWRHASGVQGSGSWCFAADYSRDSIEIIGSAGRVVFSVFEEAPVSLWQADRLQEFHIPHPPHVQQPLIQMVVDELLGKGKSPSTGDNGARVNWVMDQFLKPA